jgi:hypothetical protein
VQVGADAATAKRLGRPTNGADGGAGNADVHRFAAHVQAALGDAIGGSGQKGVGGGRAIAGNNMDGALRAQAAMGGGHQIQKARIHGVVIVGTVVAQQVADLGQ